MKAIDILAESKIDEAPVSALGQIGRKVGAAALGALGAKNAAAGIKGKAQMGDRANQYYTAYRQWLGQTGKDEKSATYADVAQFMKKVNLPADSLKGMKGLVDPAVLNQTFTKIAQDFYKGKERSLNKTKTPGVTTTGATANTAGRTSPLGVQPTSSTVSPGVQSSGQPFSVPALLQVIPQMNKRDLNKILKATQTALQGSTQSAAPSASTPSPSPVVQPTASPTTGAKAALLKPKKAVAV